MARGDIPTIGTYRNVPLEDHQPPERLELVRREIDAVLGMSDAVELATYASDVRHCPEARQLAAAMVESIWTMAAETRALRPAVDMDWLRAVTAGLGSRQWRDPWRYCSLLDSEHRRAVPRERPLTDDERA